MKLALKILAGTIRVVTSFWFVFALLLAIAASLLWRGFSPGPSKLETLAGKIDDQKFQKWFATIRTEQEKAGLRTTFDAYSRNFGSSVWARHAASELDERGKPRFFDLAEMAMSIESGEDRVEFAKAHADAYAIIVESGSADLASAYAEHLRELRKTGGRDWRVARKSPLAVAVHAATVGKPDLWAWYLENRDWVDDYLVASQVDPEDDAPEKSLADILAEFSHRPRVYRALRDEVSSWSDGKDGYGSGDGDLDVGEFLAKACGMVSLYHDTFEVLCDAGIPFGETLDVFANNIGDLHFETPDACRETGVELANLYRSHRAVWDAAAAPGGEGTIRFFHNVPQHAETVLTAFGEAGILPFLMKNYSDSLELLTAASESLVRYEAVGWSILATFAGNDEFKRALLAKGVGHLVVPYVALKGGDSSAVSECLDDPRWVKRYLNPDGSFKPETETIIEAMPFVGGIATVVKHQFRGEPVTMGEIGWAAFDVVDDAVTIAAVVAAVAATPVTGGASDAGAAALLAAKETAVQGAKQGTKVTVKQGAKQLAKQSVKAGGKYAAKKGGKAIVRKGIENAAGRESKAIARRTLVRQLAQTTGRTGAWTARVAGKSIRLVASPVTKTMEAWRKLPPAARKSILRTAAATMFFIAVTARTLPKLPVAVHETLKRTGEQVGKLVNESVRGVADGFVEAVKATLGLHQSSIRPLNFVVGGVAFGVALLLLLRRRQRCLPPARLA